MTRTARCLANAIIKTQSRPVSTAAADAAARLQQKSAGTVTIRRQVLDANQMQKLCLTVGRPFLADVDVSARPPPMGSPIPPAYHLVYFTPCAMEAFLGPDGSDASFNAPSPFTRRMWAGGQMSWPGGAALLVGDEVEEHTKLVGATAKAGDMVLVEVEKELHSPRGCSVVDRRRWIFRSALDASLQPTPTDRCNGPTVVRDIPVQGKYQPAIREISWSTSALFRFSALTFNAHKIHYDEGWCRQVEGHPAPVVHGPLTLISMLDYWRDYYGLRTEPTRIQYRAVSPLYAGDMYRIYAKGRTGTAHEMVAEKNGIACMTAEFGVNVSTNDNKPSEANWYLAMSVDRESQRPAIIIAKRGGATHATTFTFSLSNGITTKLMSDISHKLQLPSAHSTKLGNMLQQLYRIFSQKDATLLEINPLAVSQDGTMTSISPNFVFDDAAKKRQADIFAVRDTTREIGEEVEAEKHGLVYVRMQGDIGIVVNGAGLALATNDAISFEGGMSANFLDTGGKATTKTMVKAFEIVTRDERVKAILVNIYGGLTRCDMIAESIIGAAKELDIGVPMVVRLQGTNSEQGLKMLEEAKLGLHMEVESDWGAAKRVVELARLS
ncbi:hypothetical protein L249_0537 [Ophiocordyceps polyrhachis-furcata BCC 54312]|uniref:ATP-grasp domain-containing protein n=1 Tax=Ophiocordyceps polyrhachis-furcata BCC 54312 TaxID=1330021 RepID=A0A367LC76_9HYPO|nr:hypothetical protein L249_0537 [Ophiocordyceps polyrhachis-furcata BCC 54312]